MTDLAVPDHYRRRLRRDVFLSVVDEAAGLLAQLRIAGPDLLGRASEESRALRDGFPSSVRPRLGSASGGDTSSVEAAVLADGFDDPLQALGTTMCQALLAARDLLGIANDKCAQSAIPEKPCWQCTEARAVTDDWCRGCGAPAEEPGVPNCEVHKRFGLYSPVWKAGRCQFCYRYRASHDLLDPPIEAIRALENQRIERELRRAA